MKTKFVNRLCAWTILPFLAILLSSSSPSSKGVFKLVLMPDIQTYTRMYPEIVNAQTQWIAAHAKEFSFVLQQGDITDDNVATQWEVAATAMKKLDGKIPYTFSVGNHDLGRNSDVRNSDLFNTYFPYSKYSKVKTFGGAFEKGKMDNTWSTFKAGGYDWLILTLEFAPRNKVLDWANQVVKDHPKYKIILNTHAYMYSDDTRMGEGDDWLPKGYGLGKDKGDDYPNNGQEIWNKLVSLYPNFVLVVSGHVLHDGVGTLVSTGKEGNKVYQMLANYQDGVKGADRGKAGYIRILTIDTKNGTMDVKTYSPYLDKYRTEDDQQFRFENMKFE